MSVSVGVVELSWLAVVPIQWLLQHRFEAVAKGRQAEPPSDL
jgi:hypothetical protein